MQITEVRIFPMNEDKLKAYVTVTFDDCFVIRDLKVILGSEGLFVAMPSKKRKDGSFKDIAHPLNNDFRELLEKQILAAYAVEVQTPTPSQTIAVSVPVIQSKTPDQINPHDYAAPDDE